MAKFSIKSLALKWYYFNCTSSSALYGEYFNLFMKQLGFNPAQIGLTTLLGLPQFFIPLYLMFGEKFRARKTLAVLGTIGVSVCCMLPLLSLILPALQPTCYSTSSIDSFNATRQDILRNGSVRLKYAHNANNLSVSKIHKTLPYLTLTNTISKAPILSTRSVYPVLRYSENIFHPSRSKVDHTSKSSSSIQQPFLNTSSAYAKFSQSARHQITPKLHESLATSSLDNSSSKQQPRLSNDSIHSRYSNDKKQPSISPSRKYHSLMPYLATNSSLSTQYSIPRNISSYFNCSKNPTHSSKIHHPRRLLSALFLILTLSRSLITYFDRTNSALANLATITHLKEERASYGAYRMWNYLGSTFSVSSVAVLAWFIMIYICRDEKYGYFIAFIWGAVMTLLSILALPWFKFEYNEKKSFNWSGVKSDVFNGYYMFMFIVHFYTGICLAFQVYWEFWYLDGLSASPLLLGGAVLIRRPLIAVSALGSSYLISKIGDLKTVCVALLLYGVSFFALSFTRIAWLVLVIDTCQAVANGLSYCAFIVLFHKASSKENSGIILGRYFASK